MARGTGNTFGAALINALASAAGGTVGYRKSYTAVGWHAQISKLTSSPRGYMAAEKAGLSVNHRTLVEWLAEKREPNAANQERIARAYSIMRGEPIEGMGQADIEIHGEVGMGDDIRERGGSSGNAPLLIDGRQGDWRRIERAWNSGTPRADEIEEFFVVDVLEADLGEGSEPWEFPGNAYTVIIG